MSYFPTGQSTLIARRGYSGQGLGDVWDDIGAGIKDVGKGALEYYGQTQQTKGRASAAMEIAKAQAAAKNGKPGPGEKPEWLVPAAIGGGVLLLLLVMRR